MQFDAVSIESKKTATVVMLLNCDEEEVLTTAAESIFQFADKSMLDKLSSI